jgi:hypothetical protein
MSRAVFDLDLTSIFLVCTCVYHLQRVLTSLRENTIIKLIISRLETVIRCIYFVTSYYLD